MLKNQRHPFYYKRWFFLVLGIGILVIWIRYSVRLPEQEINSELLVNETVIPVLDDKGGALEKENPVDPNEQENVNDTTPEIVPKKERKAKEITADDKLVTISTEQKNIGQFEPNSKIEGEIQNGDSLSALLKRYQIKASVIEILKGGRAEVLNHLKPGHKYILEQENHRLIRLVYEYDELTTLVWSKKEGINWQVKENKVIPIEEMKTVSGKVEGSIYLSGKRLGVSPRLIKQFVDALSSQIDFSRVTANDQFTIVFKRYTIEGKIIKPDEMMAAEIIHRGETYRVIGYKKDSDKLSFYTPEGKSVKSSFLRFPLAKVERISSYFNLHRRHPILKTIRPHYGVDLVARLGTPVLATSRGKIIFVGLKGGYGRTIIVKNGPYTTLYAHLQKIAPQIYLGKEVRQGQVIGYLGSSGTSTNPHVHYEVRINNIPKDPMRIVLPQAESIHMSERKRFTMLVDYYDQIFKHHSVTEPNSEHFLVLTEDHVQG